MQTTWACSSTKESSRVWRCQVSQVSHGTLRGARVSHPFQSVRRLQSRYGYPVFCKFCCKHNMLRPFSSLCAGFLEEISPTTWCMQQTVSGLCCLLPGPTVCLRQTKLLKRMQTEQPAEKESTKWSLPSFLKAKKAEPEPPPPEPKWGILNWAAYNEAWQVFSCFVCQ